MIKFTKLTFDYNPWWKGSVLDIDIPFTQWYLRWEIGRPDNDTRLPYFVWVNSKCYGGVLLCIRLWKVVFYIQKRFL